MGDGKCLGNSNPGTLRGSLESPFPPLIGGKETAGWVLQAAPTCRTHCFSSGMVSSLGRGLDFALSRKDFALNIFFKPPLNIYGAGLWSI